MIVNTSLLRGDIVNFSDRKFDIAVVIDVLRATTTLLFALKSGARRIIPAASIDEAFSIAEKMSNFEDVILCGERNGRKIKGFHLGNSPLEYSSEKVGGRTLIYASTNGSVAMKMIEDIADDVILASIRNISAAAKFIADKNPKNLLIVCAGKEGRISLEDTYCAGMLIEKLASYLKMDSADDETTLARMTYHYFGDDVEKMFSQADHARYLAEELGFEKDVELASQIDADSIVPKFIGGKIIVDI
ncbi:2-phosphosulfolactate phosphatase [bacterium]|nr:2-phosphosulfolactate phosphatase [bacterium]